MSTALVSLSASLTGNLLKLLFRCARTFALGVAKFAGPKIVKCALLMYLGRQIIDMFPHLCTTRHGVFLMWGMKMLDLNLSMAVQVVRMDDSACPPVLPITVGQHSQPLLTAPSMVSNDVTNTIFDMDLRNTFPNAYNHIKQSICGQITTCSGISLNEMANDIEMSTDNPVDRSDMEVSTVDSVTEEDTARMPPPPPPPEVLAKFIEKLMNHKKTSLKKLPTKQPLKLSSSQVKPSSFSDVLSELNSSLQKRRRRISSSAWNEAEVSFMMNIFF